MAMHRIHILTGNHKGMTLIELMVALAIGSVLLIGLATVFFNSSRTHRELEKSGQMIEDGRYAMNLIYDDLRHAGYYGYFFDVVAPELPDPASGGLPDPCDIASADFEAAAPNTNPVHNGIAQPIQGYKAANSGARPDISTTSCGSGGKNLLTNANLSPGSDILVLRRADTSALTGTAVEKDVYLQANGQSYEFTIGSASDSDVPTTKANGDAPTMLKFPNSATHTDFADTRKYHVHVYFVAPCSAGSGANGVCQNGDPQLPTLKRLELSSDGTNRQMSIAPLIEGIQYFKVEYGIDDYGPPPQPNDITGLWGDGIPDTYVTAPTLAQWPHVVTVRVYVLARNIKNTKDYTDSATYTLAGASFGPFNDTYKRHVFSTEVRPMNIAGRREVPK
jgi:type IV pilus assembly protein PilW